jgi:hypothetical protein
MHDHLLRTHEDRRKDWVGAKDVLWNFASGEKKSFTGRCDDE